MIQVFRRAQESRRGNVAGPACYAIQSSAYQTLSGFLQAEPATKSIVGDALVFSATIAEPDLRDSVRVLNVVHEFGEGRPESR